MRVYPSSIALDRGYSKTTFLNGTCLLPLVTSGVAVSSRPSSGFSSLSACAPFSARYQKRYDGLTARFDAAKARYESLDETIRSKQSRRATIEDFLATLKDANLVDTFDTALWCGLVDFVTVHSKDDVRFTFKNGQEIKA